jgi:eukaryotic-like serine/threonine-protein kinase
LPWTALFRYIGEVADSQSLPNFVKCPSCKGDIDAEGIEVSSVIACPYCNHNFPLTQLFGKLLLLEKIGVGGMGTVYLAKDTMLERTVAVKVLKSELSADKKFIETFLHEAEITARLNHPNIVQVYTAGQQDGCYYLVMEYIEGGSLDDKIVDRGGVGELEALEIGIAVTLGLKCAQEHGLIHRDIKPGNILFGMYNTPKVADFGLSLDIHSTDRFAGEIWGTPYYLPPEKLDGEPEDFRSDMYSLGASLFHAVANRPPYDDADPQKVAVMHLSGEAVSVKTFVPTISDQTANAISRAMARYPADRFPNYDEFIRQLEDAKRRLLAAAELEKKEPPAPWAPVDPIPEKKNNGRSVAVVVVIILLLAAAAFVFRSQLFNL